MSDDVQRSLGRIESKIDNLLDNQRSHDERITSLEGDRNRAKGALWGIGIGSASLGAFLTKLLGMH